MINDDTSWPENKSFANITRPRSMKTHIYMTVKLTFHVEKNNCPRGETIGGTKKGSTGCIEYAQNVLCTFTRRYHLPKLL